MGTAARAAAAGALVLGVGAIAGAAGAASGPMTVQERLLRTGDVAGYKATAPAKVLFTAKAFASLIGQPPEAAKLDKGGFVRAAFQSLPGAKGTIAFSESLQFGTPGQADAQGLRLFREDRAGAKTAVSFPVAGVPGARAQEVIAPDGTREAEVYFTDGPFLYFGAIADPKGSPVSRAALARGVRTLYLRVKDQPAPSTD